MSEAALLAAIRAICKQTGTLCYHTHNSQRSEAGFPDCVFVVGDTILYRELKNATGKVSAEQQVWLDRLAAAGADVGVWRPCDLLDGTITAALSRALRK